MLTKRRTLRGLVVVMVLALASAAVAQMGLGMGPGWAMGPGGWDNNGWRGGGPGGMGHIVEVSCRSATHVTRRRDCGLIVGDPEAVQKR